MTALNAFLYGMPVLLMVGAGVTLFFAKRAAADIRSHNGPGATRSVLVHDGAVIVERRARHPGADKIDEAA